jgi:hypothetical protein
MTGFNSHVSLIVQPKDQYIDHVANTDSSPSKIYEGIDGHTYIVPINSDILINFSPETSEDDSTTTSGSFGVSA